MPRKQLNFAAHESCESGRRMAWPFAATTSVFLLGVCVCPAGVSTTLASAAAPAWQHPQFLRIRNRDARIRRFPQAAASRPNFWGKKQSAGWERDLETTLARTDPSGKILCHPVAHLSWYQILSTGDGCPSVPFAEERTCVQVICSQSNCHRPESVEQQRIWPS